MAQVINGHWTNRSAKAFLFRIAFDFVTQVEEIMDAEGIKASDLAKRLGITKGRVSQIMNNPGNMNLKTVVEWARALDLKVAIVAYNDGDIDNDSGPVDPQIFATCWEKAGRPTDFFAAGMVAASTSETEVDPKWAPREPRIRETNHEGEIDPWGEGINPSIWQQPIDDGVERHAGTNTD